MRTRILAGAALLTAAMLGGCAYGQYGEAYPAPYYAGGSYNTGYPAGAYGGYYERHRPFYTPDYNGYYDTYRTTGGGNG
ncbi:MAG: hypothetical protein WDN25_00430 [Acetobacteraceae bacterium]